MEYLVIGGIALIVFIILFVIVKVEKFRNRANALFLEAEKNWQDEDKFSEVCNNLYPHLPAFLAIFINEEDFKNLVQAIYDQTRAVAKDILADGKLDGKGR